jgi:S1-C subfamily serine protease
MNADEPIADVAEALLPSIVQIELPQGGVGSGVIYSSDGLILTAAHVVDGFTEVVVVLSDGERLVGEVVGLDDGNDIAVIGIDRDDLQAAPLALDSVPRVGQMAIALGSPWGLDSTVTAGIISAVQALPSSRDGIARLMLQTDASINPGNSGGPLATRDGRVVGINVSIFSSSGANDGVGFAVPIDRAYRVAASLVNGEEYASGFLGVTISPTEDGSPGAVVSVINPGTAAAEYGIQVGDQLVAVNGIPVKDATDLGALISDRQAGEVVVLRLLRNGEELTVEVTLGQREQS